MITQKHWSNKSNRPRPRLQWPASSRRGITLTEILISILIMGVGMVSLATLFPLGLLRLREATRASRSALLSESAGSELAGRGMMFKPTFSTTWYGPPLRPYYDPFVFDPLAPNAADPTTDGGIYRTYGTGVPVAYDPLWWYEVISQGGPTPVTAEARFASGIGWLRDDPDGGPPSAHGLQRLTNFVPPPPVGLGPNLEPIFASTDDYVYQTSGQPDWNRGFGDTTVPVMLDQNGDGFPDSPVADLMFTWMFTGRQTDVGNNRVFEGDVVIFHNRPFAVDPVNGPNNQPIPRVAGETVVEAIWGFGPPSASGYSLNDRSVLLRWPTTVADPDVRVGGWIADVTYERVAITAYNRYGQFPFSYPAQRCFWYRVIRRGDTTVDAAGFKTMSVTIDRQLRALTPGGNNPLRVEAALVSPYVVNVYPKVFIVQ